MNILNYTFEGFLGCAILMCLVSFFIFSNKEDIIEFNIVALIFAAIGIVLHLIAKKIKKHLEEQQ
jgi:hypothetical protein